MSNLARKSRNLDSSPLNPRNYSSNRNVPSSNPIRSPTPDSMSRREIISNTNSPLTSAKYQSLKLTANRKGTSNDKDEAIALLTAEVIRLRTLLYERGYKDNNEDAIINVDKLQDLENNPFHLQLKTEKKRLEEENTILRERINRSTISNPEMEREYRKAVRELEDAKVKIRDLERNPNLIRDSNLSISPVERAANDAIRKSRVSALSVSQFTPRANDEINDEINYLRGELQKKENQITDLIHAFETLEDQMRNQNIQRKPSAPSIFIQGAEDVKRPSNYDSRVSFRPSIRPSTIEAKDNLKRSNLENILLQDALHQKEQEIDSLKGILDEQNVSEEVARLKELLDQKDKEIDDLRRRDRLSKLTPINRSFMIDVEEKQIKDMKNILETKLNDYQGFKQSGRYRPSSILSDKKLQEVQDEEVKLLRRKLESQLREYESLKNYSSEREEDLIGKERELNELRGLLDDKLKVSDQIARKSYRASRTPSQRDAYEAEIQSLKEALNDKVKDYEALKSQAIFDKGFVTESEDDKYEEVMNLKRGILERDSLIKKLDENNKQLDFINKDLSYELDLLRHSQTNAPKIRGSEVISLRAFNEDKDKKILYLTSELQRANELISKLEGHLREKERESVSNKFEPSNLTSMDHLTKINSLQYENDLLRRKLKEVQDNKIAINITEADPISLYNIIQMRDAELIDMNKDYNDKILELKRDLESCRNSMSKDSYQKPFQSPFDYSKKEKELSDWERSLRLKESYLNNLESQALVPKKSIIGLNAGPMDIVRGSAMNLNPSKPSIIGSRVSARPSIRENLNLKEEEREEIRKSIDLKDKEMIQIRKSIRPGEWRQLNDKEQELLRMKQQLEEKDKEISELVKRLPNDEEEFIEEPDSVRVEVLSIILLLSLELERVKQQNSEQISYNTSYSTNDNPELKRKLIQAVEEVEKEKELNSQQRSEIFNLKKIIEDVENSRSDELYMIKEELEEMKRSHFLNVNVDNSDRKIERQTYELTIKQLREEIEHLNTKCKFLQNFKDDFESSHKSKSSQISIEVERFKAEAMNAKEMLLKAETQKSLLEKHNSQLKSIVEGQEIELERVFTILEERKNDNEKLLRELEDIRRTKGISEFTEHSYNKIKDENTRYIEDLKMSRDYYKELSEKNKISMLDLNREVVKKLQELDELKHRYLSSINNLDVLEKKLLGSGK